MSTDDTSIPTPPATGGATPLSRRIVMLITLLALPSLAAAQSSTLTLTPEGNPTLSPPWTWPGGANALVLSGTSNSPYAITGIAQVNITMTHSYIGDALIRLEFTPSTGPGAGTPIGVEILNQIGQTISSSTTYPSNLGGSYTFIDAPAGQSTLANNNTNYTPAPGPYRAYGKFSVPTTLSTSLTGVVGTGTWRLTFSNPGSGGGGGFGPAPSVSAASVTFTSGGCPGAWSTVAPGTGAGVMALIPGGDVMIADLGRYNPTTNTWTPLATRTNGTVSSLSVTPTGDVIAGGIFTMAGGSPANNIARYNPTTGAWSALGTGGGGVSGGTLYAVLALPGGDVIAGGDFTSAGGGGGVAVNRVARYNAATNTWSAMGTGLIGSSSAHPTAYAMALLPSGLVVIAGDFFSGNGISAGGFIRYNPTSGAWISTAGPGIANYTAALAVLPSGDVIAGGTAPVFPPAGGAYLIGRYNPTTNAWTGLGVYTSGIVGSLSTLPSGDVMVGGGFNTAGGVPVNGIARCNPNTDVWTGLGSGVGTTSGAFVMGSGVFALPSGDVIASGAWTSIGGLAVPGIARYTFGSPAPSITGQPSAQSACLSGGTSFAVVAAGAGPFTYQWRKNGTPISTTANPSAATATLSLTNIEPSDAASYDCIVSDACGSVTSTAVTLTICAADYNCSGVLSVQDIFDFLAGYFSNDPRADFNQSGTISVQDIFDFLAAYFAGCL